MIYLTTRNQQDTYTAARALSENRSPDGGFYVPIKLPQYDESDIRALGNKSFSQNVADVINRFFGTKLDSWAVEFAIGRYPVKLVQVTGREVVAETWHNPSWKFDRLAIGLEKAIRQSDKISPVPSDWLMIASRIAVLFGVFGELIKEGVDFPIDVAVANGDFSGPMAVWYAREMGLPISAILCCCNDNHGSWRLLHKGEIRTDAQPLRTATPHCDKTVPEDLERLLYGVLGVRESVRFGEVCATGGTFYLEPEQQQRLRQGLYAPVTGHRRLESAVCNLYQNYRYLPDPYTALCYSGILDYRSINGGSGKVLIISEESPGYSLEYLSKCLGLGPWELKNRMK